MDPAVLNGEPVVRGTRIPVSVVTASLARGVSFEELRREYDLTPEDVRAALAFASGSGAKKEPGAIFGIRPFASRGRRVTNELIDKLRDDERS